MNTDRLKPIGEANSDYESILDSIKEDSDVAPQCLVHICKTHTCDPYTSCIKFSCEEHTNNCSKHSVTCPTVLSCPTHQTCTDVESTNLGKL